MALKVYVLIVTDPGKTKQVYGELQKVEAIAEVHEAMGPYDIVAEFNAESLQEIPPFSVTTSGRSPAYKARLPSSRSRNSPLVGSIRG